MDGVALALCLRLRSLPLDAVVAHWVKRLVITGLVGLVPRADDTIEVSPLLPEGVWSWFELSNVSYHGRTLTIRWDETGAHFGKAAGLRVFADGKLLAETNRLTRVTGPLPPR